MSGFLWKYRIDILWLENPAADRERSRVAIAVRFKMRSQSFVAAAAVRYTAVEVFTALGNLAGKDSIPRPTFILNVEGAPQIPRQSKLGGRRGFKIGITRDRFCAGEAWIRIDIVIDLHDTTRKNVAAGKIRPLACIERLK